MKWSRAHTLVAGIGLIALTNAVALLGVVYNRSGEPSAVLRLTRREVPMSWVSYDNRENSGISLRFVWRPYGREPDWFDKAKLQALGFDTSVSAFDTRSEERYDKQLPREVLLVLEQDGPAHRRELELAKENSDREEAKSAASPGDKRLGENAKRARQALEKERNEDSRLFVVDAGLDPAALRAKYPDAASYAIVRGQARPGRYYSGRDKLYGVVEGLSVSEINVPVALHGVVGRPARNGEVEPREQPPFDAAVAFGKRLEPWITSAAKK
jgi:hypothetical protein